MQSRAERQRLLSQYYGFKCTCAHCQASESLNAASESRLEKIIELQTELSDWRPWSSGTPVMAEELIALYEEEQLYAAKAVGHSLAALAYNAVGDTKVAGFHADFALDAGMVRCIPTQ